MTEIKPIIPGLSLSCLQDLFQESGQQSSDWSLQVMDDPRSYWMEPGKSAEDVKRATVPIVKAGIPHRKLSAYFKSSLSMSLGLTASESELYEDYFLDEESPLTSPQAVANFFLDRGQRDGISLSPLKLIKLVCIAHGWALATLGRPLFSEKIQAWGFGPVVPSLYHEFKVFKKDAINRYACEYDFAGSISIPKINPVECDLFQLLEKVWEIYRNYKAAELVALTHQKDTPWSQTVESSQKIIPNELIAHHYKMLLAELP